MKLIGYVLCALVAIGPSPVAALEGPNALEHAAASMSDGPIAEGTRNLIHQIDREKLRLSGDELRGWHRLIVEAGDKGAFLNPNLPTVKLAKAVSFGAEPDVQVFAVYPNGRAGKLNSLIYATACDFVARLNDPGRSHCRGQGYTAFAVSDDGVPFAAHATDGTASEDPRVDGTALDINDPGVIASFLALRAKLLAEAKRLPES